MPQFCKLQAAQQEQQIHAPNGLAGLELLFSSVDLHKQKTRSTHQNKSGSLLIYQLHWFQMRPAQFHHILGRGKGLMSPNG